MNSAPSMTFTRRRRTRPHVACSVKAARPVEIVAPDPLSTALLLEYAAPIFRAELIAGTSWIVRLQPPASGGAWVLDLLSLVERWLESARLPCANVLYGGRSYMIRPGAHVALEASPQGAVATR